MAVKGELRLGVLRLSLEGAAAAVRAPERREAELLLSRPDGGALGKGNQGKEAAWPRLRLDWKLGHGGEAVVCCRSWLEEAGRQHEEGGYGALGCNAGKRAVFGDVGGCVR